MVGRRSRGGLTPTRVPRPSRPRTLAVGGCIVDLVESDLWEKAADWWQGHFTEGADPEYEEQILPLVERYAGGATRALDIGCGEGQVSRRLERHGAKVVGLDLAASQVQVARRRGGSTCYLQAGAQHLPFSSTSFDTVVLCLAIEHVEAFEDAIREVARVLMPGGRFVLLLVHPLLQAPGSGWVEVVDSDERFWRVGSYLEDDITTEEVGPGIQLSFVHRPISRYVMVEPPPPPATIEETGGFPNGATIPRLLLVCARRSR
jgi:SAM-dependent methyltransferase